MSRITKVCSCGEHFVGAHKKVYCFRCTGERARAAARRYQKANNRRAWAIKIVAKAVRVGYFPRLRDSGIQCADCGAEARVYDHRDYIYPLLVSPVCYSCNSKRGAGLNKTFPSSIGVDHVVLMEEGNL